MATGGYDRDLDNRVTCSICLEPYRGRHPKILPCFHSFCLPCLTQLADKEASQSVSSAGASDVTSAGDGDSSVTITCPTCRTLIPLPPAGVGALHNNPYVDDGGDQGCDRRPFTCDLCVEGQEAKLTCPSCKTYFCTRCRRTHDKLCKSMQVTEVNVKREQEKDSGQYPEVEFLEVKQMLEAFMKKLSGEAQQQRKAGGVSKRKGGQEQKIGPGVRQEGDEMDAESLTSVVKLLMQKQSDTDKLVSSMQGSLITLQNKNSLLFRDLSTVQDQNAKLKKEHEALQHEVVNLKDKNAILCQDNQQLRHEVTKMQDDVTNAQNDVSRLQECSTIVQQQQATMLDRVAKLDSKTSQLQTDVASLKADQANLQGEITSVKTDQGKLQGEITNLKSDSAELQGEVLRMKNGQDTLQIEVASVKTDQGKLQGEIASLETDQSTLQGEITSLTTNQAKLQGELSSLKSDPAKLQGEVLSLQSDQGKLQIEVASLKTNQVSLHAEMTKLRTDNGRLEVDVGNLKSVQGQVKWDVETLSTQVYFHAVLTEAVTLQKNDILICNHVVTTVGGGYDDKTGMFTAPVSGVYCFMASSSPFSHNVNVLCDADIVLDNQEIAYFLAHGKGSSTAHVLLLVKAGLKVWLRCSNTGSRFANGWLTSFSGFLVQPQL